MKKILIFSILYVLAVSCANQIALTGGEKDSEAPKLLMSEPANGSINVKEKEILFDFNELIQLKNSGQIVISPLIEKSVKYSVVGNSLVVKFPQGALKDSTTYCIDFRESIVDNNESNALKDFKYKFSTYHVIDSISVSGLVVNVKTKEVVKDVLVGLYKSRKNHIDSLKPSYIGYTGEDGRFIIGNVKEGRYLVSAIEDINKDFKLQVNESFAFINNYLDLKGNMDSLSFMLSENRNIKWTSKVENVVFKQPIIVFSKPIYDFDLLNKAGKSLDYTLNEQRDTAFLQNKVWTDFLLLKLDTNTFDTLKIVRLETKDNLKTEVQLNLETEKIKGTRVLVKSSVKIDSLNISGFHFVADSIEMKIDSIVLSKRNTVMLFLNKSLDVKTARITLDSGAITSNGIASKESSFTIAFVPETDLGKIEFNIAKSDKNFLLELSDAKGNLLRRKYVKRGGDLMFNKLYEGTYTLKVFVDENGNKIWDSADFENLKQPEPIFIFGPYQLSKGWELLANTIDVE